MLLRAEDDDDMWTMWLVLWLGGSVTDAQSEPPPAIAQAAPRQRSGGKGKRGPGRTKTLQGGSPLKRDIRSGAVAPLPGGVSELNMMLKKGRFRQAIVLASDGLEAAPLDADMHAAKAVSNAHFGDYPGAMMHLQDAMGSAAVEVLSVVAAADIERYMGDPLAGVDIRRELVAIGARPKREITLLSNIFIDYEVAGDLEGMWEVAWEAQALDPTSPVSHSLVARAYAAEGNLHEAEYYLWLGSQAEGRSLTYFTTLVEVYRTVDQPALAVTASDAHGRTAFRSVEFSAARSLALSELGDPASALNVIDLQTWWLAGEVWHPDLLVAQAVAYAGLGWHQYAEEVGQRLRTTYPGYPPAQAALQTIAQARATD